MNSPRLSIVPADKARTVAAVLFSLLVHLVVSGFLGGPSDDLSAARTVPPMAQEPPTLHEVSLQLPALSEAGIDGATAAARIDRADAEPGGEHRSQLDSGQPGRGGDRDASEQAVNLAPRDDIALLSPTWRSRLERSQLNRVDSAGERRSPEDDRVSPQVTTLTFVADGIGRPDPRRQEIRAAAAAKAFKQRPGLLQDGLGFRPRQPAFGANAVERYAKAALPGRAGRASNGFARPDGLRGADSSPADARGRQRDSVDSEQEAHNRERSLLRASPAGGEHGKGRGGTGDGEAAPAAGGAAGPGFVSSPNGTGSGKGTAIDPRDARRRSYLRNIASRIHSRWRVSDFPKEAALAGLQGYTVVSFVVSRDGSVSAVRVTRPSGYPAFDQKVRRAVFRAAPFGRLPEEMMPVLHHQHEFIVSNPAVRPVHSRAD